VSKTTIAVFFYGLFMDESLLAAKGVHPVESSIGYVDGYQLHIGERATLLPQKKGRAYGKLMELTSREAATLYCEDSVADYVAEPVVVILPNKIKVSAVCYNLPAAKLAGKNPEYAAALHTLAAELGLPASYLEHIGNPAAAS